MKERDVLLNEQYRMRVITPSVRGCAGRSFTSRVVTVIDKSGSHFVCEYEAKAKKPRGEDNTAPSFGINGYETVTVRRLVRVLSADLLCPASEWDDWRAQYDSKHYDGRIDKPVTRVVDGETFVASPMALAKGS